MHGIHDVIVAGAAAEVARDRLPNLLIRGIGIFFQEGFEGHHEAGGAEAALQGVGLVEGFLDGMQMIGVGGQALDGEDVVAVGLHREEQAGADGLAVEKDGAGAADAMLAAHVGAGQVQVVADEVAEQQAGLHLALIIDAVDAYIDSYQVSHAETSLPRARSNACLRVRLASTLTR